MTSSNAGWRLKKALIAAKLEINRRQINDPLKMMNVRYKLDKTNTIEKWKLLEFGMKLTNYWPEITEQSLVDIDEIGKKLILKLKLSKRIQEKLQVKAWASLNTVNEGDSINELRADSPGDTIQEIFRRFNIRTYRNLNKRPEIRHETNDSTKDQNDEENIRNITEIGK